MDNRKRLTPHGKGQQRFAEFQRQAARIFRGVADWKRDEGPTRPSESTTRTSQSFAESE